MRGVYLRDWSLGVLLMGLTILLPPALPAPQPAHKDTEPRYRRVCYYTNWSQYRKNGARFLPANIDPFLCTHLVFAFAKVDQRGQLAPYEWNDIQYPYIYRQFTSLKKKNPALKTLLAVGGWTHGSGPFTEMVRYKKGRQAFLDHALQYLRTHNFDGLDLDWEYPANRGSPPEDKDNFSKLLKELREGFEQEASRTGKPRLLLTAAVAGGEKIIRTAYDVPKLNKYLDFINLMSYDLHGSWSSYLGHNAPLYGGDYNTDEPTLTHSVDESVQLWLQLGASREKLVMGVPFYGRSFSICNDDDTKPGMRNCGSGKPAPYTQEKGFVSFYEMEANLADGWLRVWLDDEKVPYAFHKPSKQWIGYDDIDSIKIKAQYIKDQGLGGAMVWALDLDDFAALEHKDAPYPLGRALRDVLTDNQQFPEFKAPPVPEKKKKKIPKVKTTPENKLKGRKKKVVSRPAPLVNAKKIRLAKLSHTETPKTTQKADNGRRPLNSALPIDQKTKHHPSSPLSGLPQTLGGLSTVTHSRTASSVATRTTTSTPSPQTARATAGTTAKVSTTPKARKSSTSTETSTKSGATPSPANNSAGKTVPLSAVYKQMQDLPSKSATSTISPGSRTSAAPKKPKRPVVNPYLKFKPKFFTSSTPQTNKDASLSPLATPASLTITPAQGRNTIAKTEKSWKNIPTSARPTTSSATSTVMIPPARSAQKETGKKHNGRSDKIHKVPAARVSQDKADRSKHPTLTNMRTTAAPASTRRTRPTSDTTTTPHTTVKATNKVTVISDDSVAKPIKPTSRTSKTVFILPRGNPSPTPVTKQWLLHAMTASPQSAMSPTKLPRTTVTTTQSSRQPKLQTISQVNKSNKVSINGLLDKSTKSTETVTLETTKDKETQEKVTTSASPVNNEHAGVQTTKTKGLQDKVEGKYREDTKVLKSYSIKSGSKTETKNLKRNPSWIAPVNREQEEGKNSTPEPKATTHKTDRTSVRTSIVSRRTTSPTEQGVSVTQKTVPTGTVFTHTSPQSTQKTTLSMKLVKTQTERPNPVSNSIYSSMGGTHDPKVKPGSGASRLRGDVQDTGIKADRAWSRSTSSASPTPTTSTTARREEVKRTRWWEASTKPRGDRLLTPTTDVATATTAVPVPTQATSPSTKSSSTSDSSRHKDTNTNTVRPIGTTTSSEDSEVVKTTNTVQATDDLRDRTTAGVASSKLPFSFTTRPVKTAESLVGGKTVSQTQTHTQAPETVNTVSKTLKTRPTTTWPGQIRKTDSSHTLKVPVSPFVTDSPQQARQGELWKDKSRASRKLVPVPRQQAEDPDVRMRTKRPHPSESIQTRPQHPALKVALQDGDTPQRSKTKLHSLKLTSVQDMDRPRQLKWWHRSRRPAGWVRKSDVIRPRVGLTRPPARSVYTPTTKDCDKTPTIEQFKATGQQPENMRAGEVTYQVRQPELSPRFQKPEVQHESSLAGDMAPRFDNSLQRTELQEDQYPPAYHYNPPNYQFECPTVFGIYSDPRDCRRFYQCVWLVAFHHVCGPGTVWNDDMKICDWPTASSCRT